VLKIKTGAVYQVRHKDKGTFLLCVQFTDKNFTTGMVIEGKVTGFESKNDISSGGQTTVRNSFCEFKRIHISKGAIA
jgi:hypothetical protein